MTHQHVHQAVQHRQVAAEEENNAAGPAKVAEMKTQPEASAGAGDSTLMPANHNMTGLGQEICPAHDLSGRAGLLHFRKTPSTSHMLYTRKAIAPETAHSPACRSWQALTSAHDVLVGIGAIGNCLRAAIADCHEALQLLSRRLIPAGGLKVQGEAHRGVPGQEGAAGGCMCPVQCLQGS